MTQLERPRPLNGLVFVPRAVRYHDSFPPPRRRRHVSLGERLLAGLVVLGLVLSLLAAIALGLFFVFIALELTLAILRLIREALPR